MKQKNGFTLVELLSVIVLISLLIGIGIPGVMKISERMKLRSYKTKVSLIEKAGELWGQDNKTRLQTDVCEIDTVPYKCKKITINDLIDQDYLEADSNKVETRNEYNFYEFINPTNNNNISEKCVYVYKKNNRVYAYYGEDTDCD